jgi:hypothetical protein
MHGAAHNANAQTAPPSAPPNVSVDYSARIISWTDTPDNNEDGYRINFTIIGRRQNSVELTAPEDTASIAIPQDAPRLYCGARLEGTIVAFNSAGNSEPTVLDVPGTCPGPPSPHFDFTVDDETPLGPDANVITIAWTPMEGGVTVLLEGNLRAVPQKVPASCGGPFSAAPVQNINFSREVPIADAVYRIELPELAPDERYSIIPDPLDVGVLDRFGEPLAGVRRMKIVEGCGLDVGQPPSIGLPSTGSGHVSRGPWPEPAWAFALGLATAFAGALHLYGRRFSVR